MLTLVIALVSPLDALADDSFAWHMGQHLLLMTVAAPLLAASDAHLVLLRAFPIGVRRRIGRAISAIPGVRRGAHSGTAAWLAFGLFSATVWLWHLPAAYDAALRDDNVHILEHLSFLATAVAFWRVVGTSGGRRLGIGTGILMVTLVGLQGAMLAALITLAPRPLYAAYAGSADALADQVRAGVLMWVPASLVYLASTVQALRRLVSGSRRLRRA
jgi:cytochrome c oxidase assembly factor CtaG